MPFVGLIRVEPGKLSGFDLIREDGKKEVLGRPNLYVTTDYFLDYMGINHLEELPVIDELEIPSSRKPIIWWKDRRRWESINILPTQVWPVGGKQEKKMIKQEVCDG